MFIKFQCGCQAIELADGRVLKVRDCDQGDLTLQICHKVDFLVPGEVKVLTEVGLMNTMRALRGMIKQADAFESIKSLLGINGGVIE